MALVVVMQKRIMEVVHVAIDRTGCEIESMVVQKYWGRQFFLILAMFYFNMLEPQTVPLTS